MSFKQKLKMKLPFTRKGLEDYLDECLDKHFDGLRQDIETQSGALRREIKAQDAAQIETLFARIQEEMNLQFHRRINDLQRAIITHESALFSQLNVAISSESYFGSQIDPDADHLWKWKARTVESTWESMDLPKRKGIVYIFQHSYFTPDGSKYISGGGERYATDLSYLIDRLGYQPILIQAGNKDDEVPWVQKHGKNVVVGVNCDIEEYPKIIQFLSAKSLHIYSGFADFGKKKLTPNIMISHGITWDHPAFNANLTWIKEILFSANALVSVDTSTLCFLRSAFSCDLSKIRMPMYYIPNYADLDRYKPQKRLNDGKVHIVFPRRCSPERGFWPMVKVLPKVLQKYPQVEFRFIGYVHAQDMAEEIHRLMALYPGRIYQQLVDADKMHEVYQNADISLIPTLHSEGTSLSCIEAMACGNAVIATDIGGLPDLIINDYNGLLISPDEGSLYSAICKLVNDPQLCKRIGENAIRVAQAFSKRAWELRWNAILGKNLS